MAQIFPLQEGVFTIGRDKQFVPFDLASDELNDRPTGSLLVEIQPFLVKTNNDLLLLDTGLGFPVADGQLQIHKLIEEAGFNYRDVSKVLLSHLHKDHAGGAVYESNGMTQLSFPDAQYYIYRKEAEFALQTGIPSYMPAEIEPLLISRQVVWLDDESGHINDEIYYEHSGAHCPQHIVFRITDGGDTIFFGGDEAPQLKQMKIKYIAKYDYDGKKAMELRQQYSERGIPGKWKFLFYHDVKTPVAQL